MTAQFKFDWQVGNGAAINVELGWVPDVAIVFNLTDADEIHIGIMGGSLDIVPFSGGGTTEIAVGDTIWGVTSSATAVVERILLYSGTWAGGDAAGFMVVSGRVGTFQSENINNVSDASTADYATITVNVDHTISIIDSGAGSTDLALQTAGGNDAIAPYVGSQGSNSKGFTIGSGIAEEAKLLGYIAFRNG